MKRQVVVKVSLDFLCEQMRQGWQAGGGNEVITCVDGLPADAQFVSVAVSGHNMICLIFEHDSFAEVPDDAPLPEKDIVLERTETNEELIEVYRRPKNNPH